MQEQIQMKSSISQNLEFITLYIYSDKFILEPNAASTSINTNLQIKKTSQQYQQLNKSSPIPGNYDKKGQFSAFLGTIKILNHSFLVFVESCEKICTIQDKDIFEVRVITFVPIYPQKLMNQEDQEKSTLVFNYLDYMKNHLLKEGYYFSYNYQLSLSRTAYAEGYPTKLKFAWNFRMGQQLLKLQQKNWFLILIQGFIKSFRYVLQGKKIQYFLITRRSWKKGGTRYNARGINSKGQVANFCETQQLILINNYCFSQLQIRGSVPAFWKQSGIYAEVEFYRSHEQTKQAFLKHFNKIHSMYNRVFCINLLSKQKMGELQLILYYEKLLKQFNLDYVRYEYYDFHFACRGQKFERSNFLIQKIMPINNYFKYYVEDVTENKVINLQNGVIRTNCIDCLDRTNLIQTKIAYSVLSTILTKCGIDVPKIFGKESIVLAADDHQNNDQFIINLKNIWADNGDMISKHYTGTGSTHTNVTRTGKRDLKGIMDHGLKTMMRFYKQYSEDNFKQTVIDIILGEHTETINLNQFENRMKNLKDSQESEFVQI